MSQIATVEIAYEFDLPRTPQELQEIAEAIAESAYKRTKLTEIGFSVRTDEETSGATTQALPEVPDTHKGTSSVSTLGISIPLNTLIMTVELDFLSPDRADFLGGPNGLSIPRRTWEDLGKPTRLEVPLLLKIEWPRISA